MPPALPAHARDRSRGVPRGIDRGPVAGLRGGAAGLGLDREPCLDRGPDLRQGRLGVRAVSGAPGEVGHVGDPALVPVGPEQVDVVAVGHGQRGMAADQAAIGTGSPASANASTKPSIASWAIATASS